MGKPQKKGKPQKSGSKSSQSNATQANVFTNSNSTGFNPLQANLSAGMVNYNAGGNASVYYPQSQAYGFNFNESGRFGAPSVVNPTNLFSKPQLNPQNPSTSRRNPEEETPNFNSARMHQNSYTHSQSHTRPSLSVFQTTPNGTALQAQTAPFSFQNSASTSKPIGSSKLSSSISVNTPNPKEDFPEEFTSRLKFTDDFDSDSDEENFALRAAGEPSGLLTPRSVLSRTFQNFPAALGPQGLLPNGSQMLMQPGVVYPQIKQNLHNGNVFTGQGLQLKRSSSKESLEVAALSARQPKSSTRPPQRQIAFPVQINGNQARRVQYSHMRSTNEFGDGTEADCGAVIPNFSNKSKRSSSKGLQGNVFTNTPRVPIQGMPGMQKVTSMVDLQYPMPVYQDVYSTNGSVYMPYGQMPSPSAIYDSNTGRPLSFQYVTDRNQGMYNSSAQYGSLAQMQYAQNSQLWTERGQPFEYNGMPSPYMGRISGHQTPVPQMHLLQPAMIGRSRSSSPNYLLMSSASNPNIAGIGNLNTQGQMGLRPSSSSNSLHLNNVTQLSLAPPPASARAQLQQNPSPTPIKADIHNFTALDSKMFRPIAAGSLRGLNGLSLAPQPINVEAAPVTAPAPQSVQLQAQMGMPSLNGYSNNIQTSPLLPIEVITPAPVAPIQGTSGNGFQIENPLSASLSPGVSTSLSLAPNLQLQTPNLVDQERAMPAQVILPQQPAPIPAKIPVQVAAGTMVTAKKDSKKSKKKEAPKPAPTPAPTPQKPPRPSKEKEKQSKSKEKDKGKKQAQVSGAGAAGFNGQMQAPQFAPQGQVQLQYGVQQPQRDMQEAIGPFVAGTSPYELQGQVPMGAQIETGQLRVQAGPVQEESFAD